MIKMINQKVNRHIFFCPVSQALQADVAFSSFLLKWMIRFTKTSVLLSGESTSCFDSVFYNAIINMKHDPVIGFFFVA